MPVYPYLCTNCKIEFEETQSIKDEPLTICPCCGMTEAYGIPTLKRLIGGGTMFQLKGGGWTSKTYE